MHFFVIQPMFFPFTHLMVQAQYSIQTSLHYYFHQTLERASSIQRAPRHQLMERGLSWMIQIIPPKCYQLLVLDK
jgi:hypothetical protein